MQRTLSRRVLLIVSLLLAAGFGVGGYFFWQHYYGLPKPGSATYLEYQRAFQVGVAAMDAGEFEKGRTKENLERAVSLVPAEPAGWANLGLFHLRNNVPAQAAIHLKRAHGLAPESGEIEALLGYLAENQGDQAKAVAHFRKAVEQNPHDLPSIFTLAESVSKLGGPDSDAEYQRLMEQILKHQPNNLAALVKRAGAAHRAKEQAAFRDCMERFARLSPRWLPLTQSILDKLRKAVDAEPQDVLSLLNDLERVIVAEPGYSRDARAISPAVAFVGSPVLRFLRLEPVRHSPAPSDRNLAFSPSQELTAHVKQNQWQVLLPLWFVEKKQHDPLVALNATPGQQVWTDDSVKLELLVANAKEVRRVDSDSPAIPFPGGAKGIAPSASGVLTMDWNNDYRYDLLLVGAGGLRFWQQSPDGSFSDVTARTSLLAKLLDDDYFGAWAVDLDMDGDLDILVARRAGPMLVLRNNGDGTFRPLETLAAVRDVRSFVWADLDNDGANDAAFLDAKGQLHVLSNERSGQFGRWAVPEAIGRLQAITSADLNDDGILDLVALRTDGTLIRISDQNVRQSWQIVELARGPAIADVATGGLSLIVADLDNNGGSDLIVAGLHSAQIFLSDEQRKFAPLATTIPMRLFAVHDRNQDGLLDLLGLSQDGKPVQAANQSKMGYHWQSIFPLANPLGKQDSRLNSFGIGGEIEIRSGILVQKQGIRGGTLHFGLGTQKSTDVARVVWPNGIPQVEFELPLTSFIAAVQRLSGSCPFLFTDDGVGIHFAGDFMWGTPLGMYVNGQNIGDFPQTTEWLKIRGEHLKPRNGVYDVRVQANLWEIDFFDQLALITVDHPADTEIHVDERFFLKPTKPKLYVTSPARPVARALDHLGKDATDEVRTIDGQYLDRAGRGTVQGITRDHWVEVDLGDDAPKEGPLLLVARGWLQPTNSSINVALSQGKHEMPRPLSLEIPDGRGGWKVAEPALGFPAGKDKTMLIRLDGLNGKGVSRRVRLRTNMEIYWDFLGYASERDPKLARLDRPKMQAADLLYRGILTMSKKNGSSPEVPHYDKVTRGVQAWRDLTGYYTRFGDVRELLGKVDDRYVIMNAGDEIALRFAVPDGPVKGWKRDFIWECDGWTRDGDFNTRHGNSVLPLPAHRVKTDDQPGGILQNDPVYRRFPRDWQTYHTRYVTADAFARGLRR